MSRTILIVDDNPEERRIFSTYLQFVGGHLLEATNGEEGLHMAREHEPDLILLDLSMPIMDGWQMIRHLQADPTTHLIPVLAITAHHLPRNMLESEGFCGYLEKPVTPYRVLTEIERCLGPIHEGDKLRNREESVTEGVGPSSAASAAELPGVRHGDRRVWTGRRPPLPKGSSPGRLTRRAQ